MASRITLIAHASTAATAAAAFPADEPLEPRGRAAAMAASPHLPRADRWRHAPDRASRETAGLLGIAAEPEEPLGDWNLGDWAGRALAEIAATRSPRPTRRACRRGSPIRRQRPTAARRSRPCSRASPDGSPRQRRTQAPTRAHAHPDSRVDIAPLSLTDLRGGQRTWTLRTAGGPVARR